LKDKEQPPNIITYNFGSRKCRNDLNEVHTKNSWEKYIFKLEKYSFKLEKNIVLVDSRAAFHSKVYENNIFSSIIYLKCKFHVVTTCKFSLC
jgi:hypothetical protein